MREFKKKPFWIGFTLAIVLAFLLAGIGIEYTIDHSPPPQPTETIGGGFQLVSPAGSIVSEGTFRGRWMLLYFGASRCPYNQCEKDLKKLGQVMDMLKDKKSRVAPVFISYDIAYDTPDRLLLTMKDMNSRIIALTGGELAIRDIAIQYHVPIHKRKLPNGLELIEPYDHLLLFDPQGKYKEAIPVNDTPEQIVQKLNAVMDTDRH